MRTTKTLSATKAEPRHYVRVPDDNNPRRRPEEPAMRMTEGPVCIRRRYDGVKLRAALDTRMDATGRSALVLVVRGPNEPPSALGPLAAAIGYELVEATPEQRTALALAGFSIRLAKQKRDRVASLVNLLRAARRKELRNTRRACG